MKPVQSAETSKPSASHARPVITRAARLVDSIKRMSARSRIKVAVITAALLIALFPLPAALVERYYSNGIYPVLRAPVAWATSRVPFAIVDLLIVALALGVPAWWIVRIIKAGRGRRWRTAGRMLFNTITITAVAFLTFQLLWGLNYSRRPLAAKLDYDEERLTAEASKQMKRVAVERLNAVYAEARAAWPDESEWRPRLHSSFNEVLTQLGNSGGVVAAAPKKSLLDAYLIASGVEGFMNPFGYEVILESEILPFEKPFLLAHEWAHLAGFANESEASFVGLLACLRSDAAALNYSGLLALYQHTPWPVSGTAEDISESLKVDPPPRLSAEVLEDLKAIRERAARHRNNFLSRAQWAVYDGFLKANRVRAGIGSYGMVIRLVLGTRYDADWVPALRPE
jgi:Protein of unknown function (DUF3810)